jgi:hypothetical protein
MPAKRLSMRKICDVPRLHSQGRLTNRKIARSPGLSRAAVAEYLRRAEGASRGWLLPEGWGFHQQIGPREYASLSNEERLGVLVDNEWSFGELRKQIRRLQVARLRYPASFGDVDCQTPRDLARSLSPPAAGSPSSRTS